MGGRIDDRNLALVARAIGPRGGRVVEARVVGDDVDLIAGAVRGALRRGVDLVAVTGGLGPTDDDLSMAGVAAALGRTLELNSEALAHVSRQNARVRSSLAAREYAAREQSMLPSGGTVLPPIGTAPGVAIRTDRGAWVIVLPGPPWELRAMLAAALADGPLHDLGTATEPPRLARIFGVPESHFVETVHALDSDLRAELDLGVCARDGELEVTAEGATADRFLDALALAYGDDLYSRDGRGVDELVAEGLRRRGQTVAVAESCTAGLLGARLTSLPGSSDVFPGGVVAYDDAVKARLLAVPADVLAGFGAVSAQTAEAMARGAQRGLRADWALSVTGVAGPGGGTAEKPVGLVYVACARPDGEVVVDELRLGGTRERIRERACAFALHRLRRELGGATARVLGGATARVVGEQPATDA